MILLLVPSVSYGQQTQGESVIAGGLGYSFVGLLFKVQIDENVQLLSTPVYHLSYDYGKSELLSLGLAASYQQFDLKYNDYQYTNLDGQLVTEDFTWNIQRINIGGRALLHYGNLENFDMYSGARLSLQSYRSKIGTTDPNFDKAKFNSTVLGAQLIVLGIRGYFTQSLGGQFEMAVGSPYFISGGLCLRIH